MNTADDNRPPIYCGSEWHVRDNPRAFMIYSLALRLTEGGKNEFYVSQAQLAHYLGWNIKTVRAAFGALRQAGMFTLVRRGYGGNGLANFASVYRVIPHSKLASTDKCWPTNADTGQEHHKSTAQGGGVKTGSYPLPATGSYPLPTTGTLVSDQSPKESTNPPRTSFAPASQDSASPQKVNTNTNNNTFLGRGKINPNPAPLREIPDGFRPDESNVRYADKHGLNLKEEVASFSDLHGSIGNERSNWQAVFREHLKQAALMRGRIAVPDWMPMRQWTAYLDMRERIRKGATEAAQRIAVRILSELHEKSQSVCSPEP